MRRFIQRWKEWACLPWTVGSFLQVEVFQVDPPSGEALAHSIQGLGGRGQCRKVGLQALRRPFVVL